MSSPERAPVEVVAEPDATETTAPRLPDRALVVLTLALAAVLLIAIAVSLAFWHTQAAQPIELPAVGQA